MSCTRTFWNVAIVERAGLATREFRPVFWLTSRHAQTVIAHVLADLSFLLLRPVRWRRQAVRTFDGGEVWLDWLVAHRDEFALHGDGLFATRAPPPSPTSPVVLLLYGVGGTRDDHYMKHLARRCESRGWRAVAFSDWRLDWNEWRDLARAVEAIRASNPAAPRSIAFSGSVMRSRPIRGGWLTRRPRQRSSRFVYARRPMTWSPPASHSCPWSGAAIRWSESWIRW